MTAAARGTPTRGAIPKNMACRTRPLRRERSPAASASANPTRQHEPATAAATGALGPQRRLASGTTISQTATEAAASTTVRRARLCSLRLRHQVGLKALCSEGRLGADRDRWNACRVTSCSGSSGQPVAASAKCRQRIQTRCPAREKARRWLASCRANAQPAPARPSPGRWSSRVIPTRPPWPGANGHRVGCSPRRSWAVLAGPPSQGGSAITADAPSTSGC
jgi:hypothetical protein